MGKRYVIDRFEGEYAVCEAADLTVKSIPVCRLPNQAAEGDCIDIRDNGEILLNNQETERRKGKVRKLEAKILAQKK